MNTIHFSNLPDDLPVAENDEQKKQELEFLKSAFQTFNETTQSTDDVTVTSGTETQLNITF